VKVISLPKSGVAGQAYTLPGKEAVPQELEAAIKRSQNYLLSEQKAEGYWIGELIVTQRCLGHDCVPPLEWKVDKEWQRKAVNHILSLQLPDGGWNIYYGGPPEVNATIKAYLALKLAGLPVTDPRMLRAREVALNLGGVPRMNTFSKLYLALLGLFPWDYVPTIPCEVILIGKWFYVNINEMSSWSRSMLVPLAIINHFKPTRPLQNKVNLNELYPRGCTSGTWPWRQTRNGSTWRNFFLWLDRVHKFAEWFAENGFIRSANALSRRRRRGCSSVSKARTVWRQSSRRCSNSLIALKALVIRMTIRKWSAPSGNSNGSNTKPPTPSELSRACPRSGTRRSPC
jgi:squalene-hopene/tetraprenyl-beta-curcumene cyclase